ncbi:MAG: hypothetical protein JWM30_2787 [Burkholderia sp.]|nr:hypothetical protein [Burkholderia sp.]
MTKRDIHQRRAYADQRMVEAIDRLLASKTESERQKASTWAHAWRRFSRSYFSAAHRRSSRIGS